MGRGIDSLALGVLVVVSSLLVAPVAGAGAVTDDAATADEPSLHVDLSEDGDATVSLVAVYDFADEDERDAFETLEADEDARSALLDRFAERMGATAENANEDVAREMTVAAESVAVRTTDDRGVVVLSVTWQNLAAVDDDRLTVTEPFASGYEADRPVILTAPSGATIDATPAPDDRDDGRATWDAGTEFDGFEATVSLADEDAGDAAADGATAGAATAESESLPGFGVAVTGVAVLALLGAALHRR